MPAQKPHPTTRNADARPPAIPPAAPLPTIVFGTDCVSPSLQLASAPRLSDRATIPSSRMTAGNRKFDVARGRSRGTVRNVRRTFAEIAEILLTPHVEADITQAEFRALPQAQQAKRKAAHGYLVGAHFEGGKRKLENAGEHEVLFFDLDYATGAMLDQIEMGFAPISRFALLMHSTRSDMPEAPRARLVIPLARKVTAEEIIPLKRIIASQIWDDPQESINAVDIVTHRAGQIYYEPSISSDQKFRGVVEEGPLLDPDEVLASFEGDWRDLSQLPRSRREGQLREHVAKREDPHLKPGVIGAFCRAYTIEEAMDEFLPGIYEESQQGEHGTRYTLVGATGFNGAEVFDGGKHLHSWHGSDPAEGQHNAFDLVRLHLFGHLDGAAHPNTSPGNLPSQRAMSDLADRDDRVRHELASQFEFDEEEPEAEAEPVAPAAAPSTASEDIDDFLDGGGEGDFAERFEDAPEREMAGPDPD